MKKIIAALSTILGIIASLCAIVGKNIKEILEEQEVTISYKLFEKTADNFDEDKNNIDKFVEYYLENMVMAINFYDFSLVSDYLKLDSQAYKDQKIYINEHCKKKQIKETLLDVQIIDIAENRTGKFIVETEECFDISIGGSSPKSQSYNNRYIIEKVDNKFFVTYIEVNFK